MRILLVELDRCLHRRLTWILALAAALGVLLTLLLTLVNVKDTNPINLVNLWPPRSQGDPLLLIAITIGTLAPGAAADEPVYKGKRLTVLVNFAAGGPTDIEGRLFAKHIAKHIDGQPATIVQNMEGAGGLAGTSYLGEIAPKDGTVVGYSTGAAWLYATEPNKHRVDFRTYEFVAYQPGTTVYYVRTDVAPGMKEATDIINADKRKGAEIYLKVSGEKTPIDEVMEVLADKNIIYNTRVGGIRAFVAFMAKTGTLKNPPADWRDMFFPEALAGN